MNSKPLVVYNDKYHFAISIFQFTSFKRLSAFLATFEIPPVDELTRGGSLKGIAIEGECRSPDGVVYHDFLACTCTRDPGYMVHECHHTASSLHRWLSYRKVPIPAPKDEFLAYTTQSLVSLYLAWRERGFPEQLRLPVVISKMQPFLMCMNKRNWRKPPAK